VTIHDIRRPVADALLNRLRVAPWVVDHVVLGHARPKLLRTYIGNRQLQTDLSTKRDLGIVDEQGRRIRNELAAAMSADNADVV
jgi:hypothetical protein